MPGRAAQDGANTQERLLRVADSALVQLRQALRGDMSPAIRIDEATIVMLALLATRLWGASQSTQSAVAALTELCSIIEPSMPQRHEH